MKVKIWGCRGSLPAPGPENVIYGGNTSCVQITHGDTFIVLDAGSGIQRLGKYMNPNVKEIHILLTHLHIDHMMGLGFFLPLYDPEVKVHIWGPDSGKESLLGNLRRYFSPPLFPVTFSELPHHPVIHELSQNTFSLGGLTIYTDYLCHPGATLGYRITDGKSTVAYIPDHELGLGSSNFPHDPEWTSGYEIAKAADLLLHDAAYNSKEYSTKIGWGHSSVRDTIGFAKMCKVKKLALFHHEPTRSDEQINHLLDTSLRNQDLDFEVIMCAEGDVFEF
ncbi:ribonuclease BN (tRNA processing enzyme) [Algoriphagus boseongensis]|uniref:Ribonuclease BN (tRNA processing enzyme) n=1 Tax=Algoriphagus boseongensis TaxID=1442587 RepID=A0A4R6T6D4_9BACT|nr:MBL fold metallo-hydrolase [Algoriphagus boseongensis]TDQ16240.1 ribonuclease BN (tRNA processing enzyme) [Algoriphagus boseongensis]